MALPSVLVAGPGRVGWVAWGETVDTAQKGQQGTPGAQEGTNQGVREEHGAGPPEWSDHYRGCGHVRPVVGLGADHSPRPERTDHYYLNTCTG